MVVELPDNEESQRKILDYFNKVGIEPMEIDKEVIS